MPAVRAPVLTLLVLSALALTACGGGDKTVVKTVTAPPTQPTVTTAPSTPTTPATPTETTPPTSPTPPTNTVHRELFRAPSGNIGCAIAGGSVRCDIRRREWSPPPKPPSCDLDYGQGISVGRSLRAGFVCAGDTTLDPSFAVLPYGTDSEVGDLTCSSREDGMTCTNTSTNHGFFIARDRYRLF